jgi:hypothetical protein
MTDCDLVEICRFWLIYIESLNQELQYQLDADAKYPKSGTLISA